MQYERMDQEKRGNLFQYFTANPPSINSGIAGAQPFLLELPIFRNWTGQRAAAKDVLGLCSAKLLSSTACEPSDLPDNIQVHFVA